MECIKMDNCAGIEQRDGILQFNLLRNVNTIHHKPVPF